MQRAGLRQRTRPGVSAAAVRHVLTMMCNQLDSALRCVQSGARCTVCPYQSDAACVRRCQDCQRPVQAAEQILQQQLQNFQARLQRCAERCQDQAQVGADWMYINSSSS